MNAAAAKLTGWSQGLAIGKPVDDVFRVVDELTGRLITLPSHEISGSEMDTSSRTYKLCDGSDSPPILVEAAISINRDGEKPLGIVIVFRDITERRKAEEQKLRWQKMKAVTVIANGLGKELSESQSTADKLLAQLIDDADGPDRRLLDRLSRHRAKERGVLELLYTLGKKSTEKPAVVDVNQILYSLEEAFIKIMGRFRSFKFHLKPGRLFILVEADGLKEVLTRLVVEARQTTSQGSSVTIAAAAVAGAGPASSEPCVRIHIQNNPPRGRVRPQSAHLSGSADQSNISGRSAFSVAIVGNFVSANGGCLEIGRDGAQYSLTFPAANNLKRSAQHSIG